MDKVLFIGHYREASGWGQYARDSILALDAAGIDVVCRPVVFLNNANLPNRIKNLESKSSQGATICIQNVLSHLLAYSENFRKNIAMTMFETDSIRNTSWFQKLCMMDEIWVPGLQSFKVLREAGLTNKKIRPANLACNIYEYDKAKNSLEIEELVNGYTFYYISELTRRKNHIALLKAFHTEFSPSENVNLVLKVTKPNASPDAIGEEMSNICDKVKAGLSLYKHSSYYKNELIIPNYIDRLDMLRLHYTCDCFVCPSFGEGWCIPAFDAFATGNAVIYHGKTNMSRYLRGDGVYHCDSHKNNVFAANHMFQDFGTARDTWDEIDISSLMKNMRIAYNSGKKKIKRDIHNFSYEEVGRVMKGYILS